MIEFVRKYNQDGTVDFSMIAPELPKAYDGKPYAYFIQLRADGWCTCKSRAEGPGSIRYYNFRKIDDALAHGLKWAKRKISESKKQK
jgi:hypothetical protein